MVEIGLCHDIRRALARVSTKPVCESVSERLRSAFPHAEKEAPCSLMMKPQGHVRQDGARSLSIVELHASFHGAAVTSAFERCSIA